MGTISGDFSYSEFEATDIARLRVDNMIRTQEVRDAVRALVLEVLQPLRDAWGAPLSVNSGWRCAELNAAVGGSPSSQHLKGEAADVCPSARRNDPSVSAERVRALAERVLELGLPFDQMILYPRFLHVSHRLHGAQRGQVLYNRRYTAAGGARLRDGKGKEE